MGGNGPWEGRIEIQRGGHWMEICQDHFNQSEAEIVCKMLGFPDRFDFIIYKTVESPPSSLVTGFLSVSLLKEVLDVSSSLF